MKITVDDEKVEVIQVCDAGYGMEVQLEGQEWLRVFPSAAEAGIQARKYWEDMANDDPKELACLVGTETLVAWALGQHAGPGSVYVTSLEAWLDLHLDAPEEHWNREDGCTWFDVYIEPGSEAADEIGFDGDAVGYPQ